MKILVVDDSETVRIRLRGFLEKNGHVIYEADSGLSALEVLKSDKEIRMIISDLNMPEMDGMEFIEHTRKIQEFTDTPVLICTTEVCEELKTRAKSLGVKAWMQKPLRLSKILGVLNMIFPSSAENEVQSANG